MRVELAERKKTNVNVIKVLIDNVALAIKMNSSMFSVQDIHDHVANYVTIPEGWRSKNYAFEFVVCIKFVIQTQFLEELRKSRFNTLIIDENTDISGKKLIFYIKFRPESEVIFKTAFSGIFKLSACDSVSIATAIKKFYNDSELNLQKMVMCTSDRASVML
jgi:hypothetical protein